MNKKVIWLIIGLMSAALIGIAGMQVKWVVDTLEANEEQFDNRVFSALNGVAEKLEYQENIEALRHVDNGFAQEYYEEDLKKRLQAGEFTVPVEVGGSDAHAHLTKQQLIEFSLSSNTCNCSNCKAERAKMLTQLVSYTKGLDMAPIAERVQLDQINSFLRQELQNKGIKLPYRYGVYDNKKRSFVIADGHYVVEDSRSQPTQEGQKNLHNSDYRVNLFQQEMESPGLLMVFFPSKNSFIWSTVLKTLLSSVLFMGIILFCFAYTISVIFRQKKLSEMKNDFINNMTHEFKTPIATISLASDSISSPMVINSPDKIRRFTDIIRQENKRMNNQVEKVLQMAQMERQDFTLKISDVNLHDVITNAVEYISLQVERKEGSVTANLQAQKPMIQGDMTHISNIINNLLDNANKYSPEKPEISVSTRNVPGGVEVNVTDKGIGMSKESKKHIFEKFYRVHTGNLHDVKGFGLGLSYVKTMMDAHKGKVEVKSELGKGSSFVLFFPFGNENKN
ncbi:MAG: HAMP domain-containing histidine kinase [Lewinellaceae bacterium]|nr:HAMP domain-containing histidine kinase [Saprospiraceae bacterium]MCB9338060.1 HAMP domain-containing histidine kinase [Lewinellaceae bacterium]